MILAGVLAIVYPVLSSVAVVIFLGWLLIISGVVQAISVIGAHSVRSFVSFRTSIKSSLGAPTG